MTKKILKNALLITLSTLTLLGAIACSANVENSGKESAEGQNVVDQSPSEHFIAKVTSIVGNEVEVALADIPGLEDEDATAKQPQGGGPAVAASLTAPASEVGAGEEEAKGPEVELTGEKLSLKIPAGTKIIRAGSDETLNSIKEGTLISVMVDNKTDLNIREITIVG